MSSFLRFIDPYFLYEASDEISIHLQYTGCNWKVSAEHVFMTMPDQRWRKTLRAALPAQVVPSREPACSALIIMVFRLCMLLLLVDEISVDVV